MKQKIRFDLIGAYQSGFTSHPQEVVKSLGMTVFSFEGAPIGDCAFMEVDNLPDPLPEFIRLLGKPKFLLFTYYDYYPAGGLNDLAGSFESLEEIVNYLNADKPDNFDVLDLETGEANRGIQYDFKNYSLIVNPDQSQAQGEL